MRKHLYIIAALTMLLCSVANAQNSSSPSTTTSPSPRPASTPAQTRAGSSGFDLSDYGVRIQPEPRLIVVMAALDAAGFDPTPGGQEPSRFRAQVRKDQADLDADLRARLRTFYERNKLPATATPAEQIARYVSLAYALGSPPTFDAPARTDDLPAGLLEILDFAPLVREFYRKSGIDEQMPAYVQKYQAEGDRLRQPAAVMIRSVLSYLHTQPTTVLTERVVVKSPNDAKKKDAQQNYSIRERQRRFYIVPDLLAVPGTINLRVIADDYYAVVPYDTDPTSSELRRAYLQYVVDPLVIRFSRDIAARRDAIRQLLDERAKAGGGTASPDVFTTVARSLVAASEARLDETTRLDALSRAMQSHLQTTKDAAARDLIVKESQAARAAVSDEAVAQLADAYERGAVLAFYFAEQLRGVESSGFDIANSFSDMIASFDPARESRRPAEYKAARERAASARQARQAQRAIDAQSPEDMTASSSPTRSPLVKSLVEVDEMLRLKNYAEAEARLRTLLQEFPGEPRIFFALGQAASLSAQNVTDEDVQSERLNRALAQYRLAVSASSDDTERALLSRAHEAMGRIHEFFDRTDEAVKEFNAAIEIGRVKGGAYDEALAGKNRLAQQK